MRISKKLQENVNVFLARSSDINDAIPASSCMEKEVCSPPEEPVMLPVALSVADEPHDVSLSTGVIANEISVESDIGSTAEQAVVTSIMLLYVSSVVSYNFHVATERDSPRSTGLFVLLLDAVCGSIMLFGAWFKFMFSDGFSPGPPKKPPPRFPY